MLFLDLNIFNLKSFSSNISFLRHFAVTFAEMPEFNQGLIYDKELTQKREIGRFPNVIKQLILIPDVR